MQTVTKFSVTSQKMPEGVIYTYSKAGQLLGFEIKEQSINTSIVESVVKNLHVHINSFIEWAKLISSKNDVTVVELTQEVTFEMFWNKYNDKQRSSRKRSLKLWEKLSDEDRVMAFYFINTYLRVKGNAEKKYCETYLAAQQWRN